MRGLGAALLVIALSGCAANGPSGYGRPCVLGPAHANLSLSPDATENALAGAYCVRSTWPSVVTGYDFNLIEHYSQSVYDDQSFYEFPGRGGDDTGVIGGYTHQTHSVRTGVRVRE